MVSDNRSQESAPHGQRYQKPGVCIPWPEITEAGSLHPMASDIRSGEFASHGLRYQKPGVRFLWSAISGTGNLLRIGGAFCALMVILFTLANILVCGIKCGKYWKR